MTVRELIEKLKDLPQDAPIGYWEYYLHEFHSVHASTHNVDDDEHGGSKKQVCVVLSEWQEQVSATARLAMDEAGDIMAAAFPEVDK